MPFIVQGQKIDFSKDVQEQIKSAAAAAPISPAEPVEEKRANIQSISQLFEKTADQKIKEIAAARPIIRNTEPVVNRSIEPEATKEKQTGIPNYEVHKDVVLVRNPKKLAKRSQYLNDLLTFDNK